MKVVIAGTGCGHRTLTSRAYEAVCKAEICIGAGRVLKELPDTSAERIQEYRPHEIAAILKERKPENACVLVSGDSGFYSGAAGLLPLLEENGIEAEVLPGISSLQYFSSKIKKPWQDWNIASAHGVDCDPVYEIMKAKPVFFLTGGAKSACYICEALAGAGLGALGVTIGENLGTEGEKITEITAAEGAGYAFSELNVLLVDRAPLYQKRTPGIPDDAFIRGKVPMTKQEVRAVILSKLGVTDEDVCWDIGAGTGSVSVELALCSRSVWAVERKAEAIELMERNRSKFCAWNMHIVCAEAPCGMDELPAPDAVFVGGSSGQLASIIDMAHRANPKAKVCISAVTLETLNEAVTCLEGLGYTTSVTQVSVSRTRKVGALHMMDAQNPVFLISGS
ncbi:MAG: precorrin-6y C5,15-methyltransferase (decarboxylating) subunit CbiE [Blautia sp.]|nr:precorrin-6y C5,15-methyltransferase (decarboxylating) subunit CbiE [Blautia sp.]